MAAPGSVPLLDYFAALSRRNRPPRRWRSSAPQRSICSRAPNGHQSEEPAETGELERRLSGNRHPTDRLTFKPFAWVNIQHRLMASPYRDQSAVTSPQLLCKSVT
jgi:hypothetical protein